MTFENLTDDEPISDEWWAPLLAVEARMGDSSRLLHRCLRVDGSYRRLDRVGKERDVGYRRP